MNALTPAFKLQVAEVSATDRDPKQTFPSLYAMGLRLGEIDAEILAIEEGFKEARGEAYDAKWQSIELLEAERAPLEDLVRRTQPQTVADAIVHQAVAMSDLGTLGQGMTPGNETMPQRLTKLHHAILRGMVCVAQLNGVDLAAIGGEYYLSPWKPSAGRTSPDADLIAACAEATKIDRDSDLLWYAIPLEGGACTPPELAYFQHTEETSPRYASLLTDIGKLSAKTVQGLRSKAQLLRGFSWDEDEPKDVLTRSLLSDILGGVSTIADVENDPSADAELLAAAAAVEKGESFFYQTDWGLLGREMPDDEYRAMIEATSSHGHRLMELQAQTREGVLAKARAARWAIQVAVANEPGSTVHSIGERHERLAFSALNDLLAGDFA